MKVSIITVVYNGVKTIEDCIKSVAGQTYSNIEHIIIDGGSTDGTLDIITKYKDKIAYIICEPDNGIYDAMNKGLRLATGDIIGILNSDDMYADNSVLACVASVFANSSVDICYGDLVYVDKVDLNKVVRYWRSCDYKDGLFKKGWVPAHPTFFVRRTVHEKYGNFDLNYSLAADFELMMRFLDKYKAKSVYTPKVLVKMRVGGATNKKIYNIIKQNKEIYRALRKNGVTITPFFFVIKFLSRIKQFFSKPKNENIPLSCYRR